MLTVFSFESNEIRFVGTADKPEWVAADVCKVLGIINVSDALANFNTNQTGIVSIDIRSEDGSVQRREVLTVTEPGLYRLIFKSRKAVAEKFQNWIFDTVLPSIRKTGSYSIAPTQPARPQLPATTIQEYMIEARAWGLDTDPLIKSLITQRLAEELGSKALPSSNTQVILTTRASELGYSQKRIGTGSELGKYVKKHIEPNGFTQHGRYQVNAYELNAELDSRIHDFFRVG